MKPLNLLPQKNNNGRAKYSPSVRRGKPVQTIGTDALLKKIESRRRGVKSPRVIARKHRVLLKILLFIILFGALCFLAYHYFFSPDRYVIKEVTIVGGGKFVNTNDLRSVTENNSIGQNLIKFDTAALKKTISTTFLGAKNIDVSKDFPKTVIVKIDERIPLAIVYHENDSNYYLIDNDGYVLGTVTNEFLNLPKILYDGPVQIGAFISKDIAPTSLEILKDADANNLKISSISYRDDYTKMYVSSTEVYFSNVKSIGDSMEIFSKLYKQLILNGKNVQKIDLRYDKVIVLYN